MTVTCENSDHIHAMMWRPTERGVESPHARSGSLRTGVEMAPGPMDLLLVFNVWQRLTPLHLNTLLQPHCAVSPVGSAHLGGRRGHILNTGTNTVIYGGLSSISWGYNIVRLPL